MSRPPRTGMVSLLSSREQAYIQEALTETPRKRARFSPAKAVRARHHQRRATLEALAATQASRPLKPAGRS